MIKVILLIFIILFITYKYININIRDMFGNRKIEDFVFALKIQLITTEPDVSSYLIYDENKTPLQRDTDKLIPYQRDQMDKNNIIKLYTTKNRVKYIICFFYYKDTNSQIPKVNEILEKVKETTGESLDSSNTSGNCVTNPEKQSCDVQNNNNIKSLNLSNNGIYLDNTNINDLKSSLNLHEFVPEFKSTILGHFEQNITYFNEETYKSLTIIQIELKTDIWDYSNLIIEVI